MSYILEALKKAQAERQLGAAPDVHAPTIDAYASRSAARPAWLPAALGGAAACAAIGLALWWRHEAPAVTAPPAATHGAVPAMPAQAVPPAAAQPDVAAATANVPPAGTPPVAPVPTAGAQAAGTPPAVAPSSAAAPQSTAQSTAVALPTGAPTAAQVHAAQAAAAPSVPVGANMKAPRSAPPVPSTHTAAAITAPAPAAQPPAALAAVPAKPAAPPEPPDESIPTARDLPEPIQRILPTVAMSGYMYSKNPADRLVLIDKALRREGDEVAPGLVLERLLPKGAVFTFRGYRYRVPY